jgi:hypothetical protein
MMTARLTHLLVTFPLVALPVAAMTVSGAHASGAAAEAVRILTRAQAANDKCTILSPAERNELQRYAARAEIAATSQGAVKSAKAAAAAGKADGAGVTCSPDTQADVRETLDAARQAIAASKRPATGTPQTERRKRRQVERVETRAGEPVRHGGDGLGFYTRVVRAYYLERQCKSLSQSDARRFWRGIVDLHNVTVAANGKRAVARVMASAESGAGGSSCSQNVEAQIRRGYEEVVSR